MTFHRSDGRTRRYVLALSAGALGVIGLAPLAGPARAQELSSSGLAKGSEEVETHGLSAFGDLKLPPDFPQFGYVDPKAPKGGTFVQLAGAGTATFNSLNGFVLKGDAAIDMNLVFASLMARAYDEPDAVYGLAAERVAVSADGRIYRFRLREGIKFHDGSPITADDVVFSIKILKEQGHPNISLVLRDMEGVEAEGDRVVVVRFAAKRARDVPLFVASLPIFSRAYYTTRPFNETTLEPPVGSGPYRVGRLEQGRYLEFERVKDWWGADLPTMRGQYNFDVVRYEYYRDRDIAFEGFTAKNYVFREEYTSRTWATRYEFPALREGRVKRETIPDARPSGAQGWMFNTRRGQFTDPRVREAFALAFDYEWTNRNVMYGSYARTHSYFQNSEMMAKGMPSPAEVALLESYRGKVSDEVFGEPWVPPVTDGSGEDRRLRRRASDLLAAAGWTVKDGKRVNAKGEQLAVEFLMFERSFEPHHSPYAKNLGLLGIDARLRLVDAVQYRNRIEEFDFDMTVQRMIFPITPGDTLRTYFSSQAANTKGSFNIAGVRDPAVDELVERVIAASDREGLHTACRALDRVLRAGRYWVPHWNKASHWIAYWDIFSRPAKKPRYTRGIPETWWYDRDKAEKLERRG
jgi:microcin C transport system substrate-binding protein